MRVRAKKSLVGHRRKSMCRKVEERVVVIVGSGGAAQSCAETLRNKDNPWKGRIIILTSENCLPYDRPKLSKVKHYVFLHRKFRRFLNVEQYPSYIPI